MIKTKKAERNNSAMATEPGVTPPGEGPENEFSGLSNDERAETALAGVVGFVEACATDDCDAVADFLCNLMHLLDRMPGRYGTFADNLRRAAGNYAAEIGDGNGHQEDPRLAAFKGLLAMGLQQGEVLGALHDADPNMKDHDGTIQAARSNYANDDCEIDAKPLLSVAEDGVWVSVWVYVAIPDCAKNGHHRDTGRGTCADCGATL